MVVNLYLTKISALPPPRKWPFTHNIIRTETIILLNNISEGLYNKWPIYIPKRKDSFLLRFLFSSENFLDLLPVQYGKPCVLLYFKVINIFSSGKSKITHLHNLVTKCCVTVNLHRFMINVVSRDTTCLCSAPSVSSSSHEPNVRLSSKLGRSKVQPLSSPQG